MKALVAALVLLPALAAPALAQTGTGTALAPKREQERLRQCAREAGSRMGRAREAFIGECLKARAEGGPGVTEAEQRRKDCERAASQSKLQGEARRRFMETCTKAP